MEVMGGRYNSLTLTSFLPLRFLARRAETPSRMDRRASKAVWCVGARERGFWFDAWV